MKLSFALTAQHGVCNDTAKIPVKFKNTSYWYEGLKDKHTFLTLITKLTENILLRLYTLTV